MTDHDHAPEPIRGLPERPPPGETILWQGAPCWRSLNRRVFHARKVVVYFAILMAWSGISTWADGAAVTEAVQSALMLVPVLLVGLGLLALLAWLIGRTTVYTITNRRLVMRFGIALPMTINLPFSAVDTARLKAFNGGKGDISVVLNGSQRVGYAVLWPHVRPWRIGRPEPTMRSVPDAARVAEILADSLAAMHSVAERTGEADSPSAAEPPTREPEPLVTAA